MLFIGIDGGGTKTDAVLFNENGIVLERMRGGPSSPTNKPAAIAAKNIEMTLDKLLEKYGGRTCAIDSVFAGLSGGGAGDNPVVMHQFLVEMLPNCKILENYNDAINALRCVFPEGDAMIAIAGTGSSVFACVDEKMHQVGGWGYFFGDEGSGFDMGRRALMCALRQLDGRGEKTSLTDACREKLGMEVPKAISHLYNKGKAGVADFATVLLSEAEKGDAVALTQVKEAAAGLAESIMTAAKKIPDPIKRVALAGSVWNNAMFTGFVKDALGDSYVLCEGELRPVYGSCVIALKNAGLKITKEFETNFKNTLKPPVEIA